MTLTIILLSYAFGYWISYSMLQVEHESENRVYTHGDRFANICFSIGSLITVLIILVATWIKHIGLSGYWKAPIKPVIKKEDAK